jgi:hypothetical protein
MPIQVHLRAHNGQYLCAEGGGGGPLVANRPLPQAWETFLLHDPDGPPLLSGGQIVLQGHNGMYVCAEGGGGREVVVNRPRASIWETFTMLRADGSSGAIGHGDSIALRAYNGQYLCAEGGGGREVVANRNAVGPWEGFQIEIVGAQPLRAHQGPDWLARGQWMETDVIFSSSSRVDSDIRIWTTNELSGFTGGVGVFFVDSAENVIGNLPMHTYGVDGTWIPGLPSSRRSLEADEVDSALFPRTASIHIQHVRAPQPRLKDAIDMGAYIGQKIVEVIKAIRSNS